jgi:septal ring factor EnvC (AmiA/AmiB activator)
MESRESEIKNLVSGFTASIMNLISHYRQKRDALNQVPHFIEAVERDRARMEQKFSALRSDPACPADVIDAVEAQINHIADSEIARAKANGVDFDTLTSALRDTHRSLDNAVGKIERKGK